MDVKKLVREMTPLQQEELLTELVDQGLILVHVESKSETMPVADVYDNTGGHYEKLTILLVDTQSKLDP